MKSLKIISALIVSAFVGVSAMAADAGLTDRYAGVDLNIQTVDGDGDSAHPTALTFKAGKMFNPNVAAEVRLGFGIASDDVDGADIINDFTFGVYARGIHTIENLSPYILLGFTAAKVSADSAVSSESDSKTSFSYGLGLDYRVNDKYSAVVEWTRLVTSGDFDLSSFNVGLKYVF